MVALVVQSQSSYGLLDDQRDAEMVPVTAVLRALVEAIEPLMDPDYCSPFTSAWELDPHGGPDHRDGEVLYQQVRTAWNQAKVALTIAVLADRWFLAICLNCDPVLPQPFRDPAERDAWAVIHRTTTSHSVITVIEER